MNKRHLYILIVILVLALLCGFVSWFAPLVLLFGFVVLGVLVAIEKKKKNKGV